MAANILIVFGISVVSVKFFVLVSGFFLYQQICFKKLRQQTQWVLQWSWMLRGVGFTLETPKKGTKHDFEHKNENDTFVVVKCVCTQQNIKILQYESIFFLPKPVSKLLVNLIQFLVQRFYKPPYHLGAFERLPLHPKKVCQGPTDTTLNPSYTATAQSGRGGNFALGYTGGNLIARAAKPPAVVRDVWTTKISAGLFVKKKRPKIDRRDVFFLEAFYRFFDCKKWCGAWLLQRKILED